MPLFRMSRRVLRWEYCDIEAEDFDDALEQWNAGCEVFDDDWHETQLGEDTTLIGITALDENGKPGEDRDVENGEFVDEG